MKIPERIIKCITQIEKHGFRIDRLKFELNEWFNLYKINPDELSKELDSLYNEYDKSQLIEYLTKLNRTQISGNPKKRRYDNEDKINE